MDIRKASSLPACRLVVDPKVLNGASNRVVVGRSSLEAVRRSDIVNWRFECEESACGYGISRVSRNCKQQKKDSGLVGGCFPIPSA